MEKIMLRATPERSEMAKKLVEKTGMCKFCGQTKFMKVPEEMTDEELNDQVSFECRCEAGKIWRAGVEDEKRVEGMITESKGISFALLNNDFPEIEELVNELVPKMVKLDLKKIEISISTQTKVKIRRTDSSIKIYRTDNSTEGGEARK